ncbi:transposable element Tcb1 transposase [Trichonephila clavipes]|uniref:Transposable element Tcb1 transposase n=1 Tax=Trichonephila clavipes TaxID=2585209 RepID=A0A8X6R5G1_TRICX|nr:transposable element Tcb1 transposase [Trichonephila clavipes]
MRSHIYRNVILEQHVRLFRGAMCAEFLLMDDNARPHCANIVDECLQSEDITRRWNASQDFIENSLEKLQVCKRVSSFKPGNMSTEEISRSRCPYTGGNDENSAKTKRVVDEDHRKPIDEASEDETS